MDGSNDNEEPSVAIEGEGEGGEEELQQVVTLPQTTTSMEAEHQQQEEQQEEEEAAADRAQQHQQEAEEEAEGGMSGGGKTVVLGLIVRQLMYYGYNSIAKQLADTAGIGGGSLLDPSNKLQDTLDIINNTSSTLLHSLDSSVPTTTSTTPANLSSTAAPLDPTITSTADDETMQQELDRELQEEKIKLEKAIGLFIDPAAIGGSSRPEPDLSIYFSTSHRECALSCSFSTDGKFIATTSKDAAIKLIDVSKIHDAMARTGGGAGWNENDSKPVLKTFYDHNAAVNDIQFHPNGQVMASCSDDRHIRLYDIYESRAKRSFRYFQDSHPIKCLSFHPSGDYLLAGTSHESVRIFDVQTHQCFIPPSSSTPAMGSGGGAGANPDQINAVKYSPSGSIFATGSENGSIKIWDAINGKIITTLATPHGGAPISSVAFSSNGRYMLTCGGDSCGRLWDMSMGRQVVAYEGGAHSISRCNMTFGMGGGNHHHHQHSSSSSPDDYVFGTDEVTNGLLCWDTRTGVLVKRMDRGVAQAGLRCIAVSPVEDVVITAGDDTRMRFWGPSPSSSRKSRR